MRSFFILFFLFYFSSLLGQVENKTFTEQTLVLIGTYQERNIYVQNSFASNGVGFSVVKLVVNHEVSTNSTDASAFMIDLAKYNLKKGDSVSIQLVYFSEKPPKIINPEALTPKSTCVFSDLKIENDSVLSWCTTGENGKVDFVIEQFRWNKWIELGEVMGNGTSTKNCYEFAVDLHSGENKLRVSQFESIDVVNRSSNVVFISSRDTIEIDDAKSFYCCSPIYLTGATDFEVYNHFGELVLKGFGSKIDLSKFPKGTFYFNFDKTCGEIWEYWRD